MVSLKICDKWCARTATYVVLFPLKVYNASISHYSGFFCMLLTFIVKEILGLHKNHYCHLFTMKICSQYCWGWPLKIWLPGEPSIIVAFGFCHHTFKCLVKAVHNLVVLHPTDFLWSSLYLLWAADSNDIKISCDTKLQILQS